MGFAATTTLAPDNATDAAFRAWGGGISAKLAAMGLVQTSDTGQVNWTTVTKPSAGNTFAGYEIWRFADSLQGTLPVYFKLEYGSGNIQTNPGLRLTVGTGSNGSGTITGQVMSSMTIAPNTGSTDTTARTCIFSGDTNRMAMILFTNSSSANFVIMLSIERKCDSSGADVATGILVTTTFINNTSARSNWKRQYIPSTGAVPSVNTGSPLGMALDQSATTGNYGADTGIYLHYITNAGELCQSRNLFIYYNADITADTTVSYDLFGVSHTFYVTGVFPNTDCYNGGNTRIMMRFD